MPLFQRLRKSL